MKKQKTDEQVADEFAVAAGRLQVKETKSDKFVRLIGRRMDRALKAIEQVGNLGNRTTYEYTEANAQKVLDNLYAAVGEAKRRFTGAAVRTNGFEL